MTGLLKELDSNPDVARHQLSRMIEAVLFRSKGPMSVKALQRALPRHSDVETGLNALDERLVEAKSAVTLVKHSGPGRVVAWSLGLKRDVKRELDSIIRKKPKPRSLPTRSLHALAVIAFNQPVSLSDIRTATEFLGTSMEKKRELARALAEGIDVEGVGLGDQYQIPLDEEGGLVMDQDALQPLLDSDWIQIVGYREGPGRPALYGTTVAFLDHFGFGSIGDFPDAHEVDAMLGQGEKSVLKWQEVKKSTHNVK